MQQQEESQAESKSIVKRQEFGASQTQGIAETQAMAVAAQAKAAVEARYILALQRPREWESVRTRLQKECRRPSFAAVAKYRKPIGKGVEGPSIRFAEAALRCMTNCYPETQIIYESEDMRIIQVCVTDLEANLSYSSQIVVNKTVERRQLKDGQTATSKRINSEGKTVYLVAATEDDLLNKQNALISKALRTNALRLLPGDILDGCMHIVSKTLRDAAAQDPDKEKRSIVDAFAEIGVDPSDLALYLGHPLERIQPAELVELRGVYTAVRDGDATWNSIMEERKPQGSIEAAQDVAQAKLAKMRADAARQAVQPATEDQPAGEPPPMTEADMKAQTEAADQAPQRKMTFGGRKS